MKIAKPIARLIDSFQKLPGIGPKTAQRLTYYMLHLPQSELDEFSKSVERLKKETTLCLICKNVSEKNPCEICQDNRREKSVIMVIEQPLDILAFERTGKYDGVYHVLHGAINPLDNIGPDELFLEDLFKRIKDEKTNEVIIATNPTMEGDATAMYISKRVHELFSNGKKIKLTRLGMGIPTGADLEYADEITLTQALQGRRVI